MVTIILSQGFTTMYKIQCRKVVECYGKHQVLPQNYQMTKINSVEDCYCVDHSIVAHIYKSFHTCCFWIMYRESLLTGNLWVCFIIKTDIPNYCYLKKNNTASNSKSNSTFAK